MANNIKNKSKGCLQAKSFEVVAIKDPKLKPFLNTFHVTGRNVKQQKLGKIFGIIQIDDTSESSAYLPNLLTQIIKKAYFKNKNQDCGKSLEIALHKVNLALTELTQHEIVKWLNNLNAAIGVVCDNKIHFAQIGKGRILFLKNQKVSVIDQDFNKAEDYHPMKTFSTISSGEVKEGYKLIFTLQKTLETLKKEEIERHFKTFTSDEFDNIISSTLRNEAFDTGMVVINIEQQVESALKVELDTPSKKETELNFFGKDQEKKKIKKKPQNLKKERGGEIAKKSISPDNVNLSKSPFEKEPEIYVKETDPETTPIEYQPSKRLERIKKMSRHFTKKMITLTKIKILSKNISLQKSQVYCKNIFKKIAYSINKDKTTQIKNRLWALTKKISFPKFKKNNFKISKKLNTLKSWGYSVFQKTTQKNIIEKLKTEPVLKIKQNSFLSLTRQLPQKTKVFYKKIKNGLHFPLKKASSKRIATIALGLFVLFSFVFALTKLFKTTPPEALNQDQGLSIEKESTEIKNLKTLLNLNKDIKASTLFENNLFFLTEDKSLIKFSIRDNTKTEILLPEELQKPMHLSSIESLQLIFIISQDQVYSYSPITNSFSENAIIISDNFEGIGTGTYLTYLYLLDKNSNQLYRYHRAPGGFGPAKEWLKETLDLQNALDLDVSDSVYIAFENSKIQKYFQGKKEKEFNLGEDFTPSEIRTKINRDEVFALDKKQGKLLKLSTGNNSVISFQDPRFKDANTFLIDFENNKIFIITEKNEILTFNY